MKVREIKEKITNVGQLLNYLETTTNISENIAFINGFEKITYEKLLSDVSKLQKIIDKHTSKYICYHGNKNSYYYILMVLTVGTCGKIICQFDNDLSNEAIEFYKHRINKEMPIFNSHSIKDILENKTYVRNISIIKWKEYDPQTPFILTATSGTTGDPKDVLLPQQYVFMYCRSDSRLYKNIKDYECKNLNFIMLSPFNPNCLNGVMLGLCCNLTLYIEPFFILKQPNIVKKVVEFCDPFMLVLPQVVLPMMKKFCDFKNKNLKCVLNIGQTAKKDGGIVNNNDFAIFFNEINIDFFNIYAMTEISNVITSTNRCSLDFPTTAGEIENNDIEMKIENNEILFKSPYQFLYYERNKFNEKEIPFDKEGWFHTDDNGELINGKYLKVNGRIKNKLPEKSQLNPTYKNDALWIEDSKNVKKN